MNCVIWSSLADYVPHIKPWDYSHVLKKRVANMTATIGEHAILHPHLHVDRDF